MKKIVFHIYKIFNVRTLIFLLLLSWGQASGQINVYAGEDTAICPGETLSLDEFMAEISGDVDNGTWFSLGDGNFLPGSGNSVRFSEAEEYVPGIGDINNGWFNLLLVSDYADPETESGQESDMVTVFFQTAPTLACNTAINISLAADCTQEVIPQLVLTNPSIPYHQYQISMTDENGFPVIDNILTGDNIGMTIDFTVTHDCDPFNSCWGQLFVSDKSPPQLMCAMDTIACTSSLSPDSLGFPFDTNVVLEIVEPGKYHAYGLDACTDAEVSFRDEEIDLGCGGIFERLINRTWIASDSYGNQSSCTQEIYIRRDSIAGVIMPPNYDNIDLPAISCSSPYLKLSDGNPSPDFTGYPSVTSCSTLDGTFTDINTDICGGTYKVFRSWLVIDWCTSESRTHNQIIKIVDDEPPVFVCPSDMTVNTKPYECISTSFLINEDLEVEDCSDTEISWVLKDTLGNILHYGENNFIADLPLGRNVIEYKATDKCGNASTCTVNVYVQDIVAPNAVCEENTSVALGSTGLARLYAESLDDGSHDNCEIAFMEVMKMTDVCGLEQGRGPYVDFCCAEAGQIIQVAFIVTDIHGNENTCMVNVEVEDKLPPQITCPPHLTISCRTDIDFDSLHVFGKVVQKIEEREEIIINDGFNKGIVGLDGYVSDNCYTTITSSYQVELECNQGDIIRTFIVTDDNGLSSSCTQVITLADEDPFDQYDISWPEDYHDTICIDTAILPEISGEPRFDNDHCATLAATYDDQFFPFAEGACMKIIREWTVIDWCQYDRDTDFGSWTYKQVLKFDNTTAPVLTCRDTTICLYEEECINTRYLSEIKVSDDCTSWEEMDFYWSIDENNDGLVDLTGESGMIDAELIPGSHLVYVKTEDRCGNISSCEYIVEVKDCKAPSPYCISEVTTVLMQDVNEITVWAEDFDFGSSDNCTAREDLIFSFSPDTNDTYRTYNCDSLTNGISADFGIQIWLTDEAGNQEYCAITIQIQDNMDHCEDMTVPVRLSGTVRTSEAEPVDGVEINLMASNSEFSRTEISGNNGDYAFNSIPNDLNLTIIPYKEDEAIKGVSTLDIVKIQRHILGLDEFTDMTKILAADVNGSNSVTATDLIIIRKLILGKIDVYPNEVPTWKFIDGHAELNFTNMYEVAQALLVDQPSKDIPQLDFTAIKMGDADGSAIRFREGSTTRSDMKKEIRYLQKDPISTSFYLEENEPIFGFQLSLEIPSGLNVTSVMSPLEGFSEQHYAILANEVRISYSTPSGEWCYPDKAIFTINYSSPPEEVKWNIYSGLESEIYQGERTIPVDVIPEIVDVDTQLQIKVLGNPVTERCIIMVESTISEECQIELITRDGKVVYTYTDSLISGEQKIEIPIHEMAVPGLYYIHVAVGDIQKTVSLIKI